MVKRKITKLSNNRKKYLPEILLSLGVFLVIIASLHNILRVRSLRMDRQVVQEYLSAPQATKAAPNYPTHITIPWYVDVDIEPQVYHDGQWTVSQNQASYLTASALPGEDGNTIIYGHNKRGILGNIRALSGYEKITLTLTDGTLKVYQVQSMKEVAPNDTRLLSPTETETLTIYTCAGLLDSQRFVVRALPVSE